MKKIITVLLTLIISYGASAQDLPSSTAKILCVSANRQTSIEIKKEVVFTSADESAEKIVDVIVLRHKGRQQKYAQGEMYTFTHPYSNTTFIKDDLDNINLFAVKFNKSRTRAALYGKDLNWGIIVKPHVLMNCKSSN